MKKAIENAMKIQKTETNKKSNCFVGLNHPKKPKCIKK